MLPSQSEGQATASKEVATPSMADASQSVGSYGHSLCCEPPGEAPHDAAFAVDPQAKRSRTQCCLVATEQHISSIFVPFDNLSVIYKSHCGRGGRGVHGVRAQSRLLAVEAVASMEFVHSP